MLFGADEQTRTDPALEVALPVPGDEPADRLCEDVRRNTGGRATTDPPAKSNTRDDAAAGRGRGTNATTPIWVRAFGIVVLIAVVLFVVVMLVSGGHGPGLHTPP